MLKFLGGIMGYIQRLRRRLQQVRRRLRGILIPEQASPPKRTTHELTPLEFIAYWNMFDQPEFTCHTVHGILDSVTHHIVFERNHNTYVSHLEAAVGYPPFNIEDEDFLQALDRQIQHPSS